MVGTFNMTQNALLDLGKRSETESEDLGTLVRQLVEAAEPLQNTFNGPAKGTFNSFKGKTDMIASQLNGALGAIVGSISGQNMSFVQGAEDGADTHKSTEGATDFSDETFLQRIAGHNA
ncbi:hypothetical protein [Agrococcus baldri]|uniref:Uncharacterized protein n=1 Tax=Agrococcus baldri TaxID=153730 RepID=A0AA87RP39_9MICO|nr:hypothetical protein [Agrococcus baldri]GEK81477.1 hypothetical protein ABA31_28280 [Agrococcus baldri]